MKIIIKYEIPGRKDIEIESIIFDYNGTIAADGNIIEDVEELLLRLSKKVNIYTYCSHIWNS